MGLNHWDAATLLMATMAAITFYVQRFVEAIFSLDFEVMIFYLPLAILIAIALGVRLKAKGPLP